MSDVKKITEGIDQAIRNMCSDPGRQFSKDVHAQRLFDVIKDIKFPKNIAELFINVTMMSTPFTGAHSEDSYQALLELVKEDGNIVINLLHCISKMKDSEQTLAVVNFGSGSSTKKTKVSFEKQRSLAKDELEKRGNPEYNADYYWS